MKPQGTTEKREVTLAEMKTVMTETGDHPLSAEEWAHYEQCSQLPRTPTGRRVRNARRPRLSTGVLRSRLRCGASSGRFFEEATGGSGRLTVHQYVEAMLQDDPQASPRSSEGGSLRGEATC